MIVDIPNRLELVEICSNDQQEEEPKKEPKDDHEEGLAEDPELGSIRLTIALSVWN